MAFVSRDQLPSAFLSPFIFCFITDFPSYFFFFFFSGEKQDKLSIAVITERKYLREENMWSLAAPKYCSLLTNGAIILIDIRDFGRQEWRWRRGILSRLVLAGMPWKKGRCLFSLVCLMRLVFGGQGICF